MNGDTLVQQWLCTRTTMPDGAPGVLWRGIVYPLLPGDRIDIGVPPAEEPALNSAVLPGEEASWVLIQGLPDALRAAHKVLERAGVVISRSGRWLGDAAGHHAFDWFLRCEGRLDENWVTGLLGASPPLAVGNDSSARLSVLEQRIADLIADVARAEGALRRSIDVPHSTEQPDRSPAAANAPPEQDPALENALAEIQALRNSLEAMGSAETLEARQEQRAPQVVRTHEEVGILLAALRPDIVFIRDSLLVALGEFQSRGGFYKAVTELPTSGSRPEGWKMLRGAERWWERRRSCRRSAPWSARSGPP
jgi:hypothetical protein